MTDFKSEGSEMPPAAGVPPKRQSGHRPADMKETVAELTARAHEISKEAGSRMSIAVKELIAAAAGLAGFAIESARDLVQFMVRRGQMTQDEADKLMKEVEASQPKKKAAAPAKPIGSVTGATPSRAATSQPTPTRSGKANARATPAVTAKSGTPSKAAAKKAPAAKPAPRKPAAKKPAAKKPAVKKPAAAKAKKSPASKK